MDGNILSLMVCRFSCESLAPRDYVVIEDEPHPYTSQLQCGSLSVLHLGKPSALGLVRSGLRDVFHLYVQCYSGVVSHHTLVLQVTPFAERGRV